MPFPNRARTSFTDVRQSDVDSMIPEGLSERAKNKLIVIYMREVEELAKTWKILWPIVLRDPNAPYRTTHLFHNKMANLSKLAGVVQPSGRRQRHTIPDRRIIAGPSGNRRRVRAMDTPHSTESLGTNPETGRPLR